ncbi:hypothetical protein F0U60_47635 [Archangium minus]|uniref:Lipoprotein n=1 Tax=Archangium minus TaxID=83450 RepID=A0ABY9X6D5_9BACT|nr:hypothetical protein F0U60_47635 [Archangium minus]
MRLRNLPLVLTVVLSSCALFQKPAPQEDTSIRFPNFHEHFATTLGEQGKPYELDGVTLRALTIAANDFIPPKGRDRQCWEKQESHRYRVIRQGDIIFVRISTDQAACDHKVLVLDAGAMYAISAEGRILRRLFDGEPENLSPASHDAGEQESQGIPVPDSQVGTTSAETAPDLPASWFDGGTPDAG